MGSELQPAINVLGGGFGSMAKLSWILIPIVVIAFVGLSVWWWKQYKKKENQWTHKLKVRRRLPDNRLTDPVYHKMRRFPLIKHAEVFELEKPLLGGYLLPELEEYSGHNEYSIILDSNNRIYLNKGEYFNPDKNCIMVSAKHAEIDIEHANLKAKYQDINKVSKRVEWSTIAKYTFAIVAIMALTIIGIVGIQKWADSKEFDANTARAEAETWQKVAEVMDNVESNTNAQILLTQKLKELYGTNNIQGAIQDAKS